MPYDVVDAQIRCVELMLMRHHLHKAQRPDGCWDWWLDQSIAEFQQELAEVEREQLSGVGAGELSDHKIQFGLL